MLKCQECSAAASSYEAGWSAFFAQVPDEDPEPLLVTYCSECAAREFGPLLRWVAGTRRARRRAH
jgi:hypothetical protein